MNWGEPDLGGTPEELYEAAVENVKEHNYSAALPYAEKAAEQGHVCSMWLLSEMYEEKEGPHTQEDGTRFMPVKWGYKNNDVSIQWASVIKDIHLKEAEAGNSDAMMLLAMGHRSNFDLGSFSLAFEESDSLANVWTDRAFEADNPYAIRWKAGQIARNQKDYAASDAMYARAAELGDEAAYFWWSLNYENSPNPQRYFEILDLALQNEAPGTHELIRDALGALDKQVAQGNEVSVEWRAIADSFNFEDRLKNIPEKAYVGHFPEVMNRTECGLEWEWFFYPDGKSS